MRKPTQKRFIDAQFQIITGTSLFGNSGQYSHKTNFNISGIFLLFLLSYLTILIQYSLCNQIGEILREHFHYAI